MSEPQRPRSREDYERGLPDHHDATAGLGGAPPAQSALTLRLVPWSRPEARSRPADQ